MTPDTEQLNIKGDKAKDAALTLPAGRLNQVGIVGMPPLAVIQALNRQAIAIHDLDTQLVTADMETTTTFLPRVYCAILRTVVLNALHLSVDAIYIDVGPGKCDCALQVATVLEDLLSIPIIRTRNVDRTGFGIATCRTGMALDEKFLRITSRVASAAEDTEHLQPCAPTAGFWGVPPRDFSILNLFPATTHIYGWTRCMENKTPADRRLEIHCNPTIPTVFFAQSFCAKTALARHLATKHPQALYVDCDVTATSSVKAKIQAFLELSGVFG
jgi:hypothetical protein